VIEVPRLRPELSRKILAVKIRNEEDFSTSESTVYRTLKDSGLIYPRPPVENVALEATEA